MTLITNFEKAPNLAEAKWTFSTRNVDKTAAQFVDPNVGTAAPGDLVLCEITKIGQHKNVQLWNQRNCASYVGDLIVACVGHRYAPDQFLGRASISPEGADLLAGGGIVGEMQAAHARMSKPTQVRPIGLLKTLAGKTLNVGDYALPEAEIPEDVTVIGVFGASMNAGKTTAAVSLAHGLKKAGYTVAGVKATGTGAFGDFNAFEDAGIPVKDFTDAGMCTTFGAPLEQIEKGFEALVADAAKNGAKVVVVEIADGVFQKETKQILENSKIKDRMDAVMFATGDALGAVGGVHVLKGHGITPFVMTGMVTLSPLGTAEASAETGVPIVSRTELCTGDVVAELTNDFMRTKLRQDAKSNLEMVAA